MRFDQFPPNQFRFFKFIYHLPNFVKLFWRLFKDPRVPLLNKGFALLVILACIAFGVAYFIVRFDLIPDFIPWLGRIDDPIVPIAVIFLPGAWLFIKSCPVDLVFEHARKIDEGN
jgi:uncharacterized membrane protein YkvA (DUF1232 family)